MFHDALVPFAERRYIIMNDNGKTFVAGVLIFFGICIIGIIFGNTDSTSECIKPGCNPFDEIDWFI